MHQTITCVLRALYESLLRRLVLSVTAKGRMRVKSKALSADAQARPDQQVPGRRRARISKLKTVAGTLLDLQNDITDPITQVSSPERLGEQNIASQSKALMIQDLSQF